MKRRIPPFLLLFLLLLPAFFCTAAEFRGAWVHTGWGILGKNWEETAQILKKNGYNAVFVNFAWGGVADYPSEVLITHPEVARKGDAIQQCLDACHRRGIQVHYWKVCWNLGTNAPKETVKAFEEAGRLQMLRNGRLTSFLAPYQEENLFLECAAIREVLRKYQLDGIHLDYNRYCNSNSDFSPAARDAFERFLGTAVPKWPEDVLGGGPHSQAFRTWRIQTISRLVREIYWARNELAPGIRLSAAVYPLWDASPDWIGQDASEWIRNGWLDFICPMNYTTKMAEWRDYLEQQLYEANKRIPVYPGVGLHLMPNSDEAAKQILAARDMGAKGYVVFPLSDKTAPELFPGITPALKRKSNRSRKQQTLPPLQPPFLQKRDGRLRVAIWQNDAYGARPILTALEQLPECETVVLNSIRPEVLEQCDVVILPQPRHKVWQFRAEISQETIRDFVRDGGILMVTHAMTGLRRYPCYFPEIASANGDMAKGSRWTWQKETDTAPVPAIAKGESTFGDGVLLSPGEKGTVLLRSSDQGRPLAVLGQWGDGWYLACGLGLGIGAHDADCSLNASDMQLLKDFFNIFLHKRQLLQQKCEPLP